MGNCYTSQRDQPRQTTEKAVLCYQPAGPVMSVHSLGGVIFDNVSPLSPFIMQTGHTSERPSCFHMEAFLLDL